jgi:hypothetical protein
MAGAPASRRASPSSSAAASRSRRRALTVDAQASPSASWASGSRACSRRRSAWARASSRAVRSGAVERETSSSPTRKDSSTTHRSRRSALTWARESHARLGQRYERVGVWGTQSILPRRGSRRRRLEPLTGASVAAARGAPDEAGEEPGRLRARRRGPGVTAWTACQRGSSTMAPASTSDTVPAYSRRPGGVERLRRMAATPWRVQGRPVASSRRSARAA